MPPRLRKLALTAHVLSSVGWLGAVLAYLALALTGLKGQDAQLVRAAYLSMELIGWSVIVPCCLAALATGLVQSLGTEWGLFRHYWILVKFLLTVFGTTILLLHMRSVSQMAGLAAEATLAQADHGEHRRHLVVHAVGGLVILLTATVLSIYKPWGRTRYGKRKQQLVSPRASEEAAASATAATPVPWGRYLLFGIGGLLLLAVLLHLAGGGGPRRH
ncbi:MAG TPA: hypothetical protein VK447_08315 [Myxococcaceae bacterium]|nr:hypothetical protein [Myxococcaceae bacterium]